MTLVAWRPFPTWITIPLLVAQVGCAARSVPVTPSGVPVAVSAADRTACEELLRAEAKAARERASTSSSRSGGSGEGAWAAFFLLLFAPVTVPGLVAMAPFILIEERAAARVREAAVHQCLEPVIQAATLGPDHPDVARSLGSLASRYAAVGNDTRAEALYVRALAIQEKALEPDHPDVANTLDGYARLLRKLNRDAEADQMEARAKAIRTKQEQEQRAPTQAPGKPLSRSGIAFGEPCPSAVVSTLDELNERVTAHGGQAQIVDAECYVDGTLGKLRFKAQDG